MSSREQILADLLDRLVEAGDAERESILAEVAARDPSQARELGELLAALPDPAVSYTHLTLPTKRIV